MFFKTKKAKRKQPAQKPKVPLSKSSGLDAFIADMKAALRRCEKDKKEGVRVTAEYWRGMIEKLETIKGKL